MVSEELHLSLLQENERKMSKMILARILALVVGYFFGTFQTGYFYGKAHGIDVREHEAVIQAPPIRFGHLDGRPVQLPSLVICSRQS